MIMPYDPYHVIYPRCSEIWLNFGLSGEVLGPGLCLRLTHTYFFDKTSNQNQLYGSATWVARERLATVAGKLPMTQ